MKLYHVFGGFALSAAVLALVGGQAALGGKKDSAGEVQVSVKGAKPDASGKQQLNVTIAINKDWYIYANPVGSEDLASNATLITAASNGKAVKLQAQFPKGDKVEDKTLALIYHIYEGSVTIPVTVARAPGDTGPLELTVSVNACNKKTKVCLQNGKVKVNVE